MHRRRATNACVRPPECESRGSTCTRCAIAFLSTWRTSHIVWKACTNSIMLPWAAVEGEDDDGNGAAEEEDFGFANIEEVTPCLHLPTLRVHVCGPLAVAS